MAKNHYTRGITQLSKDKFIVNGLVVCRRYPRREGVAGGTAQVYVEGEPSGQVIGYTLADVRKVAEARKKQATPEPALAKALDTIERLPRRPRVSSAKEIDALIEVTQREVKPCPCCQASAKLLTYDWMTFTIQCQAADCRLKVERGIVNERGPRQCIDIILRAWNRRARPATGSAPFNAIVATAEAAANWLCEAAPGTDQWERGDALRKALKAL